MGFRLQGLLCTILTLCAITPLTAQWTDISPDGLVHNLRSVSFVDEMTGFVTGWSNFSDGTVQSVVVRTSDGGETWQAQALDNLEIYAVAFVDADNGFLVGRSLDCDCPVIVRTINGGEQWTFSAFTDVSGAFRAIDFYDETHGAIGGGNIQTGDGMVVAVEITPTEDQYSLIFQEQLAHVSRIVMPSENLIVMNGGEFAGTENSIYTITNPFAENPEDIEWEKQYTFDGFVLLSGLDFVSEEVGYVGLTVIEGTSFGGAVHKTTNGGSTWNKVYDSDLYTMVGMDFLDANRGIASGSGVIIMTNDGGETWDEMVPVNDAFGVWVDYVDPATAYIAGSEGTILKYTQTSAADRFKDMLAGNIEASVSPVPATSHVRIGLTHPEEGMDYSLRIFDLQGNEVHHDILGAVDVIIEVAGMPSGIYFYKISDDKHPVASGQFVVH